MKKISSPILFFGSGPVAAKSLELLKEYCDIGAVITKPSTLDEMSTIGSCSVYAVQTRNDLDVLFDSVPFDFKLAVLIDFGVIISQKIIDHFPLGIINSHFSILPEWRGADPITFSILSGQEMTGTSLMLLVSGMDEGSILSVGTYNISPQETTPSLTERLITLSDSLLRDSIPRYISGDITPTDQILSSQKYNKAVSYSRKLTKNDSILDWSKPAQILEREVRAFIGWPRSKTIISEKNVVVTRAHVISDEIGLPGQPFIHDRQLAVRCGEGSLVIDSLIPAGKKEMSGESFLVGHPL